MLSTTLRILAATGVVAAGCVMVPAAHGAQEVVHAASDYQDAGGALGGEVLLWAPTFTAGLERKDEIDVIAFGSGPRRATFVGSTYGIRMPSFTMAQKRLDDRWAARPIEHPTQGLVRVVSIPVGEPDRQRNVRARVFANCVQVAAEGPRRCREGDVRTFGGTVQLVARESQADPSVSATEVRIDSTGLSYAELLRIAKSLRPTA